MPGVIMDHGSRNGSHTNHDRDQRQNGIHGANHTQDRSQEKGKGRAPEPQQNMTPTSPTIPNGHNVNGFSSNSTEAHQNGAVTAPPDLQPRIDQLPPEIAHVTADFTIPLSHLLSRLADKTHADMVATINDLAQIPLPSSVAVVNGNTPHMSHDEDNSRENLNKKIRLLDFATSAHESWTKALVITGWSRRADDLSRVIDLNWHLKCQKDLYIQLIDFMAENKKRFRDAQLRNPDLKTALEVLTTGKASWMPDLGYIQPPPLTAKELLASLEKINTLLSIRLNLDDYDSIPLHFKDYSIRDGRVTFKVAGEFEVDLTIADEEPGSQFWFIDLRFLYHPSASVISPRNRFVIEANINEILGKEGLSGCYKYIHELVLTNKIGEFRRQAVELGRAKWIETLRSEPLNRAMSVQYWVDRYGNRGPKSWIILGVHSGKRADGRPDPKATSQLFIRWFRDQKEMKDVNLTFDTVNISTESLLKIVIARHIGYILTSMYEKLLERPLFANRELAMKLSLSETQPAESELNVQLTSQHRLSIKIDPITGLFRFSPTSKQYIESETILNHRTKNPAAEGHVHIERLRYSLVSEDIVSHGLTVGWTRTPNPGIKADVLMKYLPKGIEQILWFQRSGWVGDWRLAVCQNMSGESWWLIKTSTPSTTATTSATANIGGLSVIAAIKLRISAVSPTTDYHFLTALNLYTAGLISHYTNLKALHSHRAQHMLHKGSRTKALVMPSIFIRLSEVIPSGNKSIRTGQPWAKDLIKLTFQGTELASPIQQQEASEQDLTQSTQTVGSQSPIKFAMESAVMVSEARMIIPVPEGLSNINEMVDPDIAFNPTSGSFAFRLRSKIGEPVIPSLIERIVRVERLVDFVKVLQSHEKSLRCDNVSLGKLVFTYGKRVPDLSGGSNSEPSYKATVDFSAMGNEISLTLERGNPHLRIADLLTTILNKTQGLDGVATMLPLTLPLLCGFDTIEKAWESDSLRERGEVFAIVRAVDLYTIRYDLRQVSDLEVPPRRRRVVFEIKINHRKGDPWWLIQRTDSKRNKEADDLDQALKPIWTTSGSGWRGMRVSGVAEVGGIEELLFKVDEVMRTFVMADNKDGPTSEAPVSVQQQLPPRPQQQRQQPIPNQSQNQSQSQGQNQSHGRKGEREIVILD